MTTPDTVSNDGRNERTTQRVRRLGTRGNRDVERWLLIGGGTLVPLGILLVVLGWWGASQTPLLFEQIPYLISGGLLGLCLAFVGGFLYFAYWHTVVIRDARAQSKELTEALGRIETLLAAGAAQAGGPSSNVFGPGTVLLGPVSTPNGTMFHRPDCPVVTGRDGLRPANPEDPALRPCLICNPLSAAVN